MPALKRMPMYPDRTAILEGMIRATLDAGAAIMAVYDGDFTVELKGDSSPVTAADAAGEAVILKALAALAPRVPVVAEEEASAGRIPDTDGLFFLVDPLDGTKEFINRNGDFTVNIALIEDHAPSLGVVFAPAQRCLYVGDVARASAWVATIDDAGRVGARQPIRIRKAPADGLAVIASRSHNSPETDAYLRQFAIGSHVSRGSSLKLCLVATGEADLYPRLAPTMEWDIAAGDAVLRASGGMVMGPDGAPMRYGKPRFFNSAFVATGDVDPPKLELFLRSKAGD